jgi:hypothetical protein
MVTQDTMSVPLATLTGQPLNNDLGGNLPAPVKHADDFDCAAGEPVKT